MGGFNSNPNSCERLLLGGAAWIEVDFALFKNHKISRKKGVYFKCNEKACQSAFGVGGRSPTETKSRQGEKNVPIEIAGSDGCVCNGDERWQFDGVQDAF